MFAIYRIFAENFAFFAVRKNIFVIFIVLLFSSQLFAQEADSLIIQTVEESVSSDTVAPLNVVKIHSPKKAAWMSAVLPGLGQGYNKKYWKIPVIYAGFVGASYGINYHYVFFKQYRDEYRNRLDTNTHLLLPKYAKLSNESINANKQLYQQRMEIFIIVTAVWYLVNIIDAVVDAHLFSFDISEDISLNVIPSFQPNYASGTSSFANKSPISANVSFVFNLK